MRLCEDIAQRVTGFLGWLVKTGRPCTWLDATDGYVRRYPPRLSSGSDRRFWSQRRQQVLPPKSRYAMVLSKPLGVCAQIKN